MPIIESRTICNLPELKQVIEAFDNDNQLVIVDLINYLHKLAYTIAKKMHLRIEDAEDVAQEICRDLYNKHITDSLNIENFRAYLHKAVKNQCVNIVRKNIQLPTNSLNENEWKLFIELEDVLEEEDNKRIWVNILNQIGEPCKTILIKKILDGWQHEEIAIHLDKTTVSIRKQFERCKTKLRQLIEDSPEFQELQPNKAIQYFSQK